MQKIEFEKRLFILHKIRQHISRISGALIFTCLCLRKLACANDIHVPCEISWLAELVTAILSCRARASHDSAISNPLSQLINHRNFTTTWISIAQLIYAAQQVNISAQKRVISIISMTCPSPIKIDAANIFLLAIQIAAGVCGKFCCFFGGNKH